MSESKKDAIDISDFVYAATGARVRRLTLPNGEHWFVAADVCRELGHSNTTEALRRHVPRDMRCGLRTLTSREGSSVPPGQGLKESMAMITLKGLIRLINGCVKQECEPFKNWICDVITTVQREGTYTLARSEVQPAAPAAPPAYAMPQQVADAIVRLEERNIRSDEELIALQREANQSHRDVATALHAIAEAQRASVMTLREALSENSRTMTRVADTLDRIADRLPAQRTGASRGGMTAEQLLAAWRERLTITDDVWAVAVLLAPALVNDGEARLSIETIAAHTGLTTARVHDSLRFLLRRQCIRQTYTTDGTPAYTLHHA